MDNWITKIFNINLKRWQWADEGIHWRCNFTMLSIETSKFQLEFSKFSQKYGKIICTACLREVQIVFAWKWSRTKDWLLVFRWIFQRIKLFCTNFCVPLQISRWENFAQQNYWWTNYYITWQQKLLFSATYFVHHPEHAVWFLVVITWTKSDWILRYLDSLLKMLNWKLMSWLNRICRQNESGVSKRYFCSVQLCFVQQYGKIVENIPGDFDEKLRIMLQIEILSKKYMKIVQKHIDENFPKLVSGNKLTVMNFFLKN